VAKFSHFKDRELVRRQAPKTLKGTGFYVQEQFPVEVEQWRKSLFPVMRDARQQHKKVKLVRGRLYIDGVEYIPELQLLGRPRDHHLKIKIENAHEWDLARTDVRTKRKMTVILSFCRGI
jgi:hypothetical protein